MLLYFTMKLTISKDILNFLDLTPCKKPISWSPAIEYFEKPAGDEFYRLIAYIAQKMPPQSLLLDIGTYYGLSAIALASNIHCKVISYDIYDYITDNPNVTTIKNIDNIDYRLKDCLEDETTLTNAQLIVLDVDPHDGIQEAEFFAKLRMVGFKGIVILDDIQLNPAMKQFWSNIPERKVDVTAYGHWSGTGIVYFSDEHEFTFS